jgi:hypothetical protein
LHVPVLTVVAPLALILLEVLADLATVAGAVVAGAPPSSGRPEPFPKSGAKPANGPWGVRAVGGLVFKSGDGAGVLVVVLIIVLIFVLIVAPLPVELLLVLFLF